MAVPARALAAPVADPAPARIGPNAIIQAREAMADALGRRESARILGRAGLGAYVFADPAGMVDEREVVALHQAMRDALGEADAAALASEAGRRTGRYILENRIPKPIATVLRLLPAPIASRMLLAAIARHAWTFAGSGRFRVVSATPRAVVEIAYCPLARGARLGHPAGAFYAGTFEALFRALVHRDARARQTACEAMGDPVSRFTIRWRAPSRDRA